MEKENRIIIEIPEAQLDFSNESWKESLRKDFRAMQNALESKPNPSSPAYYTWFWFFMKYGRSLCSEEAQKYLKENNLSPFTFVKDVVGLTMTGGGAYTIGYKFFDECLKNTSGIDVSGIKINWISRFKSQSSNKSLQKIYYGAPGTGKSHIINEITEGESVIRTTFHPDSDYSTFVGAYKPTTKEVTLRDLSGHPVKENGVTLTEDRIIYEFVDQAFLQAYVQAWKYFAEADESSEPQKQYLIIEEINRGNCAQIFGDLFQLLDRNASGFSDYPINADNDMKKQLAKAFKGLAIAQADRINACYKGKDVISKVLSGEIILLPSNIYIWATMNTSDQSLFPIDSAFKRRWDWQYMPICKGRDENGNELNWKIAADTKEYDWWSFLTKINDHINATTNSEDKKLGFFFCKPQDGCISSETFVGKVIFYLWNDVFKDFGFEGPIFKDTDGSELSFNKFHKTDDKGKAVVQKDKVELFLENLGVEIDGVTENEIDIENDTTDAGKAEHKETLVAVTVNGERLTADGITQFDLYLNAIKKLGVDRIAPAIESMKYRRKGSPMATKNKVQGVLDSDGYNYVEAGGYYFIKGANGYTLVRILEDLNKSLNLNIQIEYR